MGAKEWPVCFRGGGRVRFCQTVRLFRERRRNSIIVCFCELMRLLVRAKDQNHELCVGSGGSTEPQAREISLFKIARALSLPLSLARSLPNSPEHLKGFQFFIAAPHPPLSWAPLWQGVCRAGEQEKHLGMQRSKLPLDDAQPTHARWSHCSGHERASARASDNPR